MKFEPVITSRTISLWTAGEVRLYGERFSAFGRVDNVDMPNGTVSLSLTGQAMNAENLRSLADFCIQAADILDG